MPQLRPGPARTCAGSPTDTRAGCSTSTELADINRAYEDLESDAVGRGVIV